MLYRDPGHLFPDVIREIMLNSQEETPAKKNKEAKAEHKEEKLEQSNLNRDDLHEAGVISEQQMQIAVETLEDKAEVNLDLQVRS